MEDNSFNSLFDQRRTIWVYANRMADVLLVALFWTLTSLPIITIGASSTAAYYVYLRMARNEDGYLWRNYWKSFKLNFVQSTILFLVQLAIGAGLGMAAYYYYMQETKVGAGIYALLFGMLLVWLVVCIYLPPVICRFSNTTWRLFTTAVFMPFRAFGWTVLLVAIALAFIFVGWYVIPSVLIIYGVYAYASSYVIARVFRPYEEAIAARTGGTNLQEEMITEEETDNE